MGMMKSLALALIVVLASPVVTAQEPSTTPIRVAVAAYLAASTADAITTGLALDQAEATGEEANPLFRPFASRPWLMVSLRMAMAVGLAYWAAKAYPRHPKLTQAVLWIATGTVSVIAVRNARFIR